MRSPQGCATVLRLCRERRLPACSEGGTASLQGGGAEGARQHAPTAPRLARCRYVYGPQPSDLGDQRALDFVLDNGTLQVGRFARRPTANAGRGQAASGQDGSRPGSGREAARTEAVYLDIQRERLRPCLGAGLQPYATLRHQAAFRAAAVAAGRAGRRRSGTGFSRASSCS